MITIHYITNDRERELVKRLFKKRIGDIAGNANDINSNINGDLCFYEDGAGDCIFGDGAVVYDTYKGGDAELGWMVYDFREEPKCYTIDEQDLAGLVNELPSNVFPF